MLKLIYQKKQQRRVIYETLILYNIIYRKNQQKQNKYRQLSYEQRLLIEFYMKNKKKLNLTMKDIAKTVGISERTLYREIKRGMVYGLLNSDLTKRNQYSAQKSQKQYTENITQKQRELKIGKNRDLANYLEYLMLEKIAEIVFLSFKESAKL